MADMTNESGLLRCPFCGGEATIIRPSSTAPYVLCCKCHCGGPVSSTADEQQAIEAWNTRSLISPAGEVVVPVEPTEAMIEAGDKALFDGPDASEYVWSAMLSAAPRGMEG